MNAVVRAAIEAPSIAYSAVLPMLIVFGAAVLAVIAEAFVPRAVRARVQLALTVLALAAALVCLVLYILGDNHFVVTAGRAIAVDGPAEFLWVTILVLGLLGVLGMAERGVGHPFTPQASAVPGSAEESFARKIGLEQTEIYPLALFSIGGMLLFTASNDLLTMFVALEVLSLPLYLMCGLARRRRLLSQEAALKYFLLGAFSSGFFLYGVALLYGFSGSVVLDDIASAASGTSGDTTIVGQDPLLLIGTGLLAVGLLFKVAAVPFHSWTPDVYQGAPTPVTGFMAACTKVAAFGALLRVLYVAVPGLRWDWQPVLFFVAILTMLLGSIVAIVQADVKRMLAYSSIAHAGFLLVGLLAMNSAGVSSVLFYLVAYGFATIGAFSLITLVRTTTEDGGVGGEATHLSQWAGIGRRYPWIAVPFSLFLLAMAGIPLTSGFAGKYAVFSASLDNFTTGVPNGGVFLVIIGVLASAIAAFFYVRVIVLMYFSEPTGQGTTVIPAGFPTTFVVTMGVAVTILLGVFPGLVLDLAEQSAAFLR